VDLTETTTCPRATALHDKVLANPSFCDDQFVNIQVMVVLCIGDRRLQTFLYVDCDTLLREGQIVQRFFDLLAANKRSQQVQLLRRGLQHA